MDPITLAMLASAAASTAQTLPSLIPTEFDKENKRRLAELQARERAGNLGLTDKEQAIMERRLSGGMQAAAMGAEAERNRLLAGSGGASAGQALLGAQIADEQRQAAQERINTEIMAADEEKKRRQIEEMRALQATEGERQKQALGAAGAIIGSGVEAGVTTAAQERLFAGSKAPSQQSVQALAQSLNVSPDEARGYIELSVTNPEIMKYITAVRGK